MAEAAGLVGKLRDAFGKKELATCKTLLAQIKVVLATVCLRARRARERAAFALARFLNRRPRCAALCGTARTETTLGPTRNRRRCQGAPAPSHAPRSRPRSAGFAWVAPVTVAEAGRREMGLGIMRQVV
jgi:hypothetical protein